MKLLKLNGEIADIDEKTSIGINIQCYDVAEPGKRKVNTSNEFSIPMTSGNMAKLGFAGNVQYTPLFDTTLYSAITCDYIVENKYIIKDAKVRIESISDRIYLFIFEKNDIWEQMKLFKWPDFVDELLAWLQSEKSLPSYSSPFDGTLEEFLTPYIEPEEGIILPFYFGNFYSSDAEGEDYLEDEYTLWLRYGNMGYNGGHFCVFAKSIFEFIEYKYGVNFLTDGTEINGNIWNDEYASQVYIPVRGIMIKRNTYIDRWWFTLQSTYPVQYAPYSTDLQDKEDKTLFDFVNAFFQHFNIIKDELFVDGEDIIRLARFDEIADQEVINWSGKIQGTPKFKPYISGFGQKSYIKFLSIYSEGDSLVNAKEITCLNENIDAQKDLFTIDAHVPAFVDIDLGRCPDLSTEESFKTFVFLINDFQSYPTRDVKYKYGAEYTAALNLWFPALYNLDNEYTLIESALEYPVFYEIEKWLTLNDVISLEFFKLYYVQELNASFFINKISGFNPLKSNAPTKIELFKVSDKVALIPYLEDWFEDGVSDPFTDGNGSNFYWTLS